MSTGSREITVQLKRTVRPEALRVWEAAKANPLVVNVQLPAGQTFDGALLLRAELHAARAGKPGALPLAVSNELTNLTGLSGSSATLEFTSAKMNLDLAGRECRRVVLTIAALWPSTPEEPEGRPETYEIGHLDVYADPTSFAAVDDPPPVNIYAPYSLVSDAIDASAAAMAASEAATEAVANAVRFDAAQTLTRVQRSRARANVGLASAVCVSSVLPATFTPANLDLSVSSAPVSSTIWQDYRARIQDILDSAAASGQKVIWDARVPVAGLVLRSGTFIEALPGCGAIVPNNANLPIFSNEHWDALRDQETPQTPNWATVPKTRGITIDGGTWHGNGQNQIHSNLTEGWTVPLRFFNVEDLTLKNLTIYKPRTFAAQFFNWFNVVFEDIYIDVGVVGGYNFDGLHFNSGERLRGRGLMVKSMDDALAFNADEPWTQSDGVPAFFQSNLLCPGPIRDVQVRDVMLMDAGYGMRVLSGGSRVDNITIDGVSGRHGQHLLCIDNYDEVPFGGTGVRAEGPGNIGTITLRNVNTTWTGGIGYKNGLVYVGCNIDRLIIDGFTRNPDTFEFNLPVLHARRRAWKVEQGVPVEIGEIIFNDYKARLQSSSLSNGVYYHVYNDGCHIKRIEVNNPTVINNDPAATILGSGALVHSVNGGHIDLVEISNPSTNYLATWTRTAGGTIGRTVVRNPRETVWREGGTIADTCIQDDPNEPGVFTLFLRDGMTYADALGGPAHAFTAAQAIGGEFQISNWGALYLHVRQPSYALRRAGTTVTRQGYSFRIRNTDVALTVYTTSAGGGTLAQITGLNLDVAETWLPELEANGNAIRAYLRRKSDGQWLSPSGSWQALRAPCMTAFDNRMPTGQPMIAIQGTAGTAVKCRDVWQRNLTALDYSPEEPEEEEHDDLSAPLLEFRIRDASKVLTAADAPAGYWDEVAKLLDTSGNDNHATAAIGYRPRYLAHNGEDYILLPGTAGNSVSVPYFPELHVGGDLTIEAKISIANKTAGVQVIMERWQNSGAILLADCWHLQITSAGLLRFLASHTGAASVGTTNALSTEAWPFANHEPGWIRVTYDVDNGAGGREIKFWTSEDGETWEQLGETVVVAGATSIIDAPSVLRIGHSSDTGPAYALAGRLFRARVRSGLGDASAVIVDIDPAAAQDGANTFPDAGPHGVEVTINRGTASTRATVIKSGMLLFDGVDDHFTLAAPVALSGSVTYLARQQPFGNFVGVATSGTNAAFSPFHQSNSLHFTDASNAWSLLSHAPAATVRYIARTGKSPDGRLYANGQPESGLVHSVVGAEAEKRLAYIGRRGANYAHGLLGDIAVHPKLSDAGMALGDEWLSVES